MEGKYLITTDNWFYAPDGLKYRSVWGEVKIVEDSVLGLKTNRGSTNWYAYVGDDDKGMVVAGCQIHYAVRCEEKPNTDTVRDFTYGGEKTEFYQRPTEIYIAERIIK
jgi:secreted PhoX family phosphatase